jgi:hypothetical protein
MEASTIYVRAEKASPLLTPKSRFAGDRNPDTETHSRVEPHEMRKVAAARDLQRTPWGE